MPVATCMFLTASQVRMRFDFAGRPHSSKAGFGHLQLPTGYPAYPASYIDAFLRLVPKAGSRPNVLRFNNTPEGQRAFQEAQAEFARRIEQLSGSEPHPGFLTVVDVTSLLGVTRTTVDSWRHGGRVEFTCLNGLAVTSPDHLMRSCTWQFPTS